MRVWIETTKAANNIDDEKVTLYVRVWIETSSKPILNSPIASPST